MHGATCRRSASANPRGALERPSWDLVIDAAAVARYEDAAAQVHAQSAATWRRRSTAASASTTATSRTATTARRRSRARRPIIRRGRPWNSFLPSRPRRPRRSARHSRVRARATTALGGMVLWLRRRDRAFLPGRSTWAFATRNCHWARTLPGKRSRYQPSGGWQVWAWIGKAGGSALLRAAIPARGVAHGACAAGIDGRTRMTFWAEAASATACLPARNPCPVRHGSRR